jgi:hypothetical protein
MWLACHNSQKLSSYLKQTMSVSFLIVSYASWIWHGICSIITQKSQQLNFIIIECHKLSTMINLSCTWSQWLLICHVYLLPAITIILCSQFQYCFYNASITSRVKKVISWVKITQRLILFVSVVGDLQLKIVGTWYISHSQNLYFDGIWHLKPKIL